MKKMPEISVLGLWHLGMVTAACLAEMGIKVRAYDRQTRGIPQVYEPGLEELLKKNLNKNLVFAENLRQIAESQIVIIAYDTPLDDQDEADLSGIFSEIRKLAPLLKDHTVVAISSQVPLGTSERIEKLLKNKNKTLEVAYLPENLRLGRAVNRFTKPKMIVIGARNEMVYKKVKQLYKKIKAPKIFTDLKTAEMVKHALNSFLATSISWANEMGNLSARLGVDFYRVAEIIKLDERIGPGARILPGWGFSGGTLARDLKIIDRLSKVNGFNDELIKAVWHVNEAQKKLVVNILQKTLGKVTRKKIGILGLTYTTNTSTLRRSLAIETIYRLQKLGAVVSAFDPHADQKELQKYPDLKTVTSFKQLSHAADALVLFTPWPEFLSLPWKEIKKTMKTPLVVDPGNFLARLNLLQRGFIYEKV